MYCTKCGKNLKDGMLFCMGCGAKVGTRDDMERQKFSRSVYAPVKTNNAKSFVSCYLGFILLGLLFIVTLTMGLCSPLFFDSTNLTNIFRQLGIFAPVAFAVVITTRAKGPDISIGSMIAISGIIIAGIYTTGGSWVTGLLLAVFACGFIGAVNGAVAVLLKVPSLIVTLITSAIVRGAALASIGGIPILIHEPIPFPQVLILGIPIGALVLMIITFIAAFFLVLQTRLGMPMQERNSDNKPVYIYITAYIISGVFAALVGFYMLSRLQSANANIGMGYEMYILFVFACVTGSKVIDNKAFAVVYALAPAVIWVLLRNAMCIIGTSSFEQMIWSGVITLIFIGFSYLLRHDKLFGKNQ